MKRTANPRLKQSQGLHAITLIDAGESPVTVTFEWFYAARKTTVLRIHPDARIEVIAPNGTPLPLIEKFVTTRARWLLTHLATIKARAVTLPEARRYVSGELYRYLGTVYPLLVERDAITRVVLLPDMLRIGLHDPENNRQVQTMLVRWYRLHAEQVFAERLADALPQVAALGISKTPTLAIRLMKTRWGSCTTRGKITLNLKLIQAPLPLIDYVVLHELCHLREMNHGPRFWALVAQLCPDWRQRRKTLNQSRFEGVPTM